MPSKTSPNAFDLCFEQRRNVPDPIAAEVWTFEDAKGRKRQARIAVGKPQRVPKDKNGDWFCPVYVETWTPHVVPALGVGPLDSLMNAVTLVRSFRDHVGNMHISSDRGLGRRKK